MTMITPCLWFDGDAEAAATLYVSVFPNSQIDAVHRAPADYPAGRKGDVLTVDFTLDGQRFQALNGGPDFPFTEAVSFSVETKDQAETDRYWDALIADDGKPVECGWLKDRFGLSWQIVPKRLADLMGDPDPARAGRAMAAMMTMVKIDIAALEAAAAGEKG